MCAPLLAGLGGLSRDDCLGESEEQVDKDKHDSNEPRPLPQASPAAMNAPGTGLVRPPGPPGSSQDPNVKAVRASLTPESARSAPS